MKIIVKILILIGLVMISGPDKAVAQWGDMLKLGVDLMGDTDEALDASASPEEQERQKQLGIKLAKEEKEALFELQKSIFILEKMTEIGGELVTAQMDSNYGVFTDSDKFNQLIVSMSNLSEVLKDESQVVHDNKLFLKVKVEKIEKNSARMRSQLDQEKKESKKLMEIVNARSSKVPKLLVDKFYPALRNSAKDVSVKLQASINTINEITSATTYKSLTGALKMASGGLGIAEGLSNLGNASSDPSGALLSALKITEGTTEFVGAATSTASLLSNFSETMDEFNEYKGSIEEMSVSLLDYIDASKKLHEEGLVLLEEAHKSRTEEARLKQALGNVADQEELENPFEEAEIQMAALDGLDESMDTVWKIPIDDVPEGDYQEDLALQVAEAEKMSVPETPTKVEPSPPKQEVANKKEGGMFGSIGSWFGWGGAETALDSGSKLKVSGKEMSSADKIPDFIRNIELVDEQEPRPPEESKMLSTAVVDPALDIELGEKPIVQTAEAEKPTESEDQKEMELSQDIVDSSEIVEVAHEPELQEETETLSSATLEPVPEAKAETVTQTEEVIDFVDPDVKVETLSTATLEPAPKVAAGIKEEAIAQAVPVEKTPAERLQEEIDLVAKVTSSGVKQEELAHIKFDRKKEKSQENLQVAKLEPVKKNTPEEPVEGYACVHAKKANLRKGPGTNYQKLAQVKIYTPVKRLKKTGKWVKIKNFQDEVFWIYQTLITEKYLCGTVAQDKVEFYTKPDFNSFPFYGAPMNAGFSVRILSLENENDWVKVVDSAKNISWVQKSMLRMR